MWTWIGGLVGRVPGILIVMVAFSAITLEALGAELEFDDAHLIGGIDGIGGYVRVVDLDGDGLDDVVVIGFGVGQGISVTFSLGGSEFSELINLVPGIGMAEFADFNGDDSPDMVFRDDDLVRILFNGGVGLFPGAGVSVPFSQNLFGLVPGDFDGDGDMDVVASERLGEFGAYQTRRSLFRNDGAGNLSVPVVFSLEDGARLTGVAADFTGDAIDDLATLPDYLGDGTLRVFPGLAAGGFGAPTELSTCGEESNPRIVAADVNGDTWVDLVFTPGPGTFVCVVLNDGRGAFGEPMSYDAGTRAADVDVCDFDLDGDMDVVVPGVSGLGGGDIAVVLNAGDGSFPDLREFVASYEHGAPGGSAAASGDFDGDGRPDVAAPNYGPELAVFMNATAVAGDADDDGDVDLDDFAAMVQCVTGPGGGVTPACENLDIDGDQDVDWTDFALFQRAFSG